jgi:hypothetical protein
MNTMAREYAILNHSTGALVVRYAGLQTFIPAPLSLAGKSVAPNGLSAAADYAYMTGDPSTPFSLHSRITREIRKDGTQMNRYSTRLHTFIQITDTVDETVNEVEELDVTVSWSAKPELQGASQAVAYAMQILFTSIMGVGNLETDPAEATPIESHQGVLRMHYGAPDYYPAT